MHVVRCLLVALLLLVPTLHACGDGKGVESTKPSAVALEVVRAFPRLTFTRPLDLQNAGDGTDRLFVVEQAGRIQVFQNVDTVAAARVFLDIRDQVNDAGNEEGLLGLAFHPDFATSRHYFVYYCLVEDNQRKTRVSRFTADAQNPSTTEAGSEQDVITINQPFSNHNGGQIAFGPDGYLYIAVGDGGSGNDPLNSGQDRTTLLGSILRLDVSSLPYTIPSDNPFASNQMGYREEIYAYGLRNPWRFSFDPVTNRLWVGDVGQNAFEEIDVVEKGKNYGWNIMEARICRPPTRGCSMAGLELPVWEYAHASGGKSITGGYVYRGSNVSGLVGTYVYADYITGEIWGLLYDGVTPASNALLRDTNLNIASFGTDEGQELFICAFDGKIYKLDEK
ncbi:MAG: PQQ-dependent sugar dehydrogenase [Candidatus Krumholzibacteria bacterium]|nr:PQQ-dependent sugar dehydrogenase [Candidatus Krumholzibacteria bacterium]